ncbi:Negative elongation factor A [Orchesella cincta]|uniref:Negative elongation factor A n=1 Tax=Orchesella cincta TaxID=48709 RepID=A0A1D2MJ72_ORCCI|nr:Negative elongation factor A [Orchesella cincta]
MANVRDSDISLWLHNKLGSNESWTSGSISSQLTPDVLRNIKECFIDLQTQVKLKLLLSFFHIPRRNLEEWKHELEEILDVAMADTEQWVAMLAEMMKSYPSSGCLNFELSDADNEDNRRIFEDLVHEVTGELKNVKDLNLLPLECHYLNKNALQSVVGTQKQPVKHFTIKRKSKSANLRAELLQKAADAVKTNTKKIPAPTIPLRTRGMPRKMTDTTPLKGIPSQAPTARTLTMPASIASRTLSRTPAGKKEGGVKLLEITEQPVGFQMQKRRKKQQEIEDSKKTGSIEEAASTTETPDYAAGLTATVRPPTPPPPIPVSLNPPPTPSPYQPPTPQPVVAPPPPTPVIQPTYGRSSIPDGPPPTPNPQLPNNPEPTTPTTTLTTAAGYLPVTVNPPTNKTQRHNIPLVSVGAPQPMTKTVILQVPTNQTQQIVTLSKELMEQAQEIFRTANKATRPEKEHILKFMAGTRENPCPELGSIVTIKLSEHEEQLRQKDGTILAFSVETHFQMNYKTGEWKVIQKPPKIDNAILQHQVLATNL